MSRNQRRLLVSIVAIAALVRVVQYWEVHDYVLLRVPLVDAQENVEWAALWSRGGTLPADVFYKPPFYPLVLSWMMRLCGPDVGSAYLLNGILGVLDVALLAGWMRRFAPAPLALAAAAVAALYAPFLYYEVQALPTTLAVTLALCSLLLLDGGGTWRRLLTGLVLGFLVLTRPSFLVWAGGACLWLLASGRGARAALLVGLGAAVAILPVTLRNRARGGAWVLVSANSGINFYLGNNADWERTWLLRPGLEWEELVRRIPESERLGQARWDRYFARQAWDWVRHEPLGFAAAVGRRTLHLLSSYELDRNLDIRSFRAHSRVLRWSLSYAVLAPWLFLGLVLAWRRGGTARLAAVFWLCTLPSMLLVFVSERYRVDAAPATLAMALLGAGEMLAHLRRRPTVLPAWSVVSLVLIAAALTYGDWGKLRRARGPHGAALEGVAYYKEGNLEAARLRLQAAIAADPTDADAHYQLGTTLQKQGQPEVALQAFTNAARLVPGNPKPPMAAGMVLRGLGRREEALASYERACSLEPQNAMLHLETARLLEEMGRSTAARQRYETALERATDPGLQSEARRGRERVLGAGP